MVSLDDQILIATRRWLIEATDLPGDRIVPADDSGTRPDLPYLTVQILTSDVPSAWDEKIQEIDEATGSISENIIGRRTGSIQIDGYGRGAFDQITKAALGLRLTQIRQQLRADRLSVRPEGGINDLSQLVDDEIEKRFQRDFALSYAVTFAEAIEDAATPAEVFEGDWAFSDHEFQTTDDLTSD